LSANTADKAFFVEFPRGYPKRKVLFLGCHGHGFAWPCFGRREDTATQSRDRGAQDQHLRQVAPNRLLGQPLIYATQAEALVSGHAGGNAAMIARPSWGLGGLDCTPLRRLRIVVSGVETALRQQAGVERHADTTPFWLRGPSVRARRMLRR